IAEEDGVVRNLRGQRAATFFALHSAHLEDVGKVSPEPDAKFHLRRIRSVVMQPQTLLQRFLPEDLRAENVHRAARDGDLILAQDIGVHEIDGENCVIILDRRAEQKRARLFEGEGEGGNKSSVLVIKAQLAPAKAFDVSEAVENGKAVVGLEHAGAIVDPRRGGENIEIFAERDYFLSHRLT